MMRLSSKRVDTINFIRECSSCLNRVINSKIKILVKLYGEDYDCLNEDIKLTAEERAELRKLKGDIKQYEV